MNKDELLKVMDDVPFFRDMDGEDRALLLGHDSHWMTFKTGESILNEDEVDYGFFVLLQGQVSVVRTKPTEISLAQLVPGSIFGEITMKAKRPRTSSIQADENVSVFKVDGPLVDQLPPNLIIKIKDQIIDLVISRLDEVNNRLSSFIR